MGEALLVRRGGALGDDGLIIEPGLIVEFFGLENSIPDGWLLCDGTNDTPDLRDKFIVGVGDTYAIGATGGNANAIVPSHTHTASNTNTVGNHTHSIVALGITFGTPHPQNVSGPQITYTLQQGGAHTHSNTVGTTGSSATNANLPPYFSLLYIIKEV